MTMKLPQPYKGLGRGPHNARIGSVTEHDDGTVVLAWHIGEYSFAQKFGAAQIAEILEDCGLPRDADPREVIDKRLTVLTATYGGFTEARVVDTEPLAET